MRQYIIMLGLFILLAGSPTLRAESATGRDLAAALPADTLVVVRARNVSALLRQWSASPLGRLAGDPRAAAFFKPLQDSLADFREMVSRRQLGDPAALGDFLNGELVLAGVPASQGAKDPIEWIWLYEHKADPQLLARLGQPLAPRGATVRQTTENVGKYAVTRTETVREVDSEIPVKGGGKKKNKNAIVLSGNEPGPVMLKQQVVKASYDYFGPTLVVHAGASRQAMAEMLGKLDSAAANSATGPLELRSVVGADADLEAYVNGEALAVWLQDQARHGKWDDWVDLRAMRLNEIKAAAVALKFEQGRLAINLALCAPESRQGISRLLLMGGQQAPDLAGAIPSGALAYTATSYPLGEFARATLQLLPQVSPLAGTLVQFQLQQFENATGLGFDKNIIQTLGTQWGRFLMPTEGAHDAGDMVTHVAALADPAALRDALPRLLEYGARAFGAYSVEQGKVGEYPLWTIYPAGEHRDKPITHICIAGKWLLAGSRLDGINAFADRLKNKGGALAERPEVKAAMARLPGDRYGEFWQSPAGLREMLALTLPEPEKGHKKGKAKSAANVVDPASLPDASVFAQFVGPVSGALSRKGDTVQIRAVVPLP